MMVLNRLTKEQMFGLALVIVCHIYYYYFFIYANDSHLQSCLTMLSSRDGGVGRGEEVDYCSELHKWTSGEFVDGINMSQPLGELHPCHHPVKGNKTKPIPDKPTKSVVILDFNPDNVWKIAYQTINLLQKFSADWRIQLVYPEGTKSMLEIWLEEYIRLGRVSFYRALPKGLVPSSVFFFTPAFLSPSPSLSLSPVTLSFLFLVITQVV
eukprot:TRINITY_DN2883_c0_g1_i1.p1 TRINITY_DN2883_c0_g1~~TRINITY_DN2883_c0_g1_i1.p1  ORF type:complete len:219 (-),score=42.23 TRINITY_DN2883_c0_g1_i1:741-1370(-)